MLVNSVANVGFSGKVKLGEGCLNRGLVIDTKDLVRDKRSKGLVRLDTSGDDYRSLYTMNTDNERIYIGEDGTGRYGSGNYAKANEVFEEAARPRPLVLDLVA